MVVLAIVTSITAIVFTSQNSFNKTLILANTAYDIALTFRSAATYGLGGRTIGNSPTGYGIHLDKATPQSLILFPDIYPAASAGSACHSPINTGGGLDAQPGDCVYQSGQDTPITSYAIGNNAFISDFCAFSSGNWSCAYANGGGLATLDIVFGRPNPDALISKNRFYSSLSPVTSSCLTISSSQGGSRSISVSSSGKITADALSCP